MTTSERIKSILFRIVPERRFLSIAGVIILQFIVYCSPKLFEAGRHFNDLTSTIDNVIPFVPFFVVFYVLAFFQWVTYYLLLAREEEDVFRRYLTAAVISKLTCLVIFVFYPTTMVQPEITSRGLFSFACRVIYFFDTPTNLFPSMHCVESWFCLRLALEQRRRGRIPVLINGHIRGFSGNMYSFVNSKNWPEMKNDLVQLVSTRPFSKVLRGHRKWILKAEVTPLPENEIAHDEVFIRSHTVATCLLSGLVVLSTVFIKQHLFVDTVAGILLTELSLYISSLLNKSK